MGRRYLLDTHVLIWALTEPKRLSPRVRALLEDPDTPLLVSSASAWEMATKHRLGKFSGAEAVLEGLEGHLSRLGAAGWAGSPAKIGRASCRERVSREA